MFIESLIKSEWPNINIYNSVLDAIVILKNDK